MGYRSEILGSGFLFVSVNSDKIEIPSLRFAKTEDPMVMVPSASIFSIGPSTWIWAERIVLLRLQSTFYSPS